VFGSVRQIIGTEGDTENEDNRAFVWNGQSSVVDTKLVYRSNRVLEGKILWFLILLMLYESMVC